MENKKVLPPLEKHSDVYKLIIPPGVEKKIRYLCSKISQVEWSGTLFYTCSGSYEENNIEVRCVDIFLMDVGSATYTEFDMSPDVIAYMSEHPELLDCQMGLIHSHNNMATFFSGTDTSTLKEEGNDRNHFVSLIVNNEGTYTAAITRKLKVNRTVKSFYTYRTFDDLEKTGERNIEAEEEIIAYNYLEVIKEGEAQNSFPEIDERFNLIKRAKEEEKRKTIISESPYTTPYYSRSYTQDTKEGKERKAERYLGPTLFDEEYMESEPPRKVEKTKDVSDVTIPAPLVKQLTLQLLTGSITISDSSKIDPEKWATQMVVLFNNRFNGNMSTFKEWVEIFLDFILVSSMPKGMSCSEEVYVSELSRAIYLTIDKLPQNKYIEAIKETLLIWMI